MKLTMDKTMTTVSQVKDLKAAMKEFKAMYTDNDLKNALLDALHDIDLDGTNQIRNAIWESNILRCDVEAYPSFSTFFGGATYRVEMVLEKWNQFLIVSFFCYHDLTVEKRYGNISVKTFNQPVEVNV